MLKIRLMRIGAKKKPFYRVVVVEQRSKRTGGYIELLGTYNPLSIPKDIKLNKERIEYWIKQGAQPSVGYLRIIGKAIQKQPRKAKKEKKEVVPIIPQEEPKEETKSETDKAISEVESVAEEVTSTDSDSQQTHSEPQSKASEPETTKASGTLQSDESTPAESKTSDTEEAK